MQDFNSNDPRYQPMSVGDWIKTYLLMLIPIVNIVLMFVWAFSDSTNISKRNYFRANLIIALIVIIICIAAVAVLGTAVMNFGSSYNV